MTPTSTRTPGACSRKSLASSEDAAALFGSSRFRALADDALKDEDNAAWVLDLPADARDAWLSRIHWIRLVDRLAENERFEPERRRFHRFVEGWRRLRAEGTIAEGDPFARELAALRAAWLTPAGGEAMPRVIAAWDAYLEALEDYHAPDIRVRTLAQHDDMLWRLSGRIFQLVPFLTEAHWDAAGEFGRLDQLFNNLRDLQEDADHGICYLPEDVLARFGVAREDVLSGRCADSPRWQALMGFWLDEHLPALRRRAAPFIEAEGLHPSLEVMRTWSSRRHARVERVLRAVSFDFRRFPARYWATVRRELAQPA